MDGPFDGILREIRETGYHNHRRPTHSDLMTERIIADLTRSCAPIAEDLQCGKVMEWRNVKGPDGRNTDAIIGPSGKGRSPKLDAVRLLIEHKSVITAHRNRNARQQDIEREIRAAHANNPNTIIVATVLIGTCERVLNVPDGVKAEARRLWPEEEEGFNKLVRPRLSTGDQALWKEFEYCISNNQPAAPYNTIKLFRELPLRKVAETYKPGLDFLLLVPVAIDNVNPPRVDDEFANIHPTTAYEEMIQHICYVYNIRWRS